MNERNAAAEQKEGGKAAVKREKTKERPRGVDGLHVEPKIIASNPYAIFDPRVISSDFRAFVSSLSVSLPFTYRYAFSILLFFFSFSLIPFARSLFNRSRSFLLFHFQIPLQRVMGT